METRWDYITGARVISQRRCKLLDIVITPSATNSELTIYNGENTTAPVILAFFNSVKVSWALDFHEGIICDRGLYFGSFTSITGVLVQWEEL